MRPRTRAIVRTSSCVHLPPPSPQLYLSRAESVKRKEQRRTASALSEFFSESFHFGRDGVRRAFRSARLHSPLASNLDRL